MSDYRTPKQFKEEHLSMERFGLRLKKAEIEQWRRAARIEGMTLSAWLKKVANNALRKEYQIH